MRRRAIAYALLSAILFGASTPLVKLLVGSVAPLALAGLLYLGSGLGLAMWVAVRRSATATNLSLRDLPSSALSGSIKYRNAATAIAAVEALGLRDPSAAEAARL